METEERAIQLLGVLHHAGGCAALGHLWPSCVSVQKSGKALRQAPREEGFSWALRATQAGLRHVKGNPSHPHQTHCSPQRPPWGLGPGAGGGVGAWPRPRLASIRPSALQHVTDSSELSKATPPMPVVHWPLVWLHPGDRAEKGQRPQDAELGSQRHRGVPQAG